MAPYSLVSLWDLRAVALILLKASNGIGCVTPIHLRECTRLESGGLHILHGVYETAVALYSSGSQKDLRAVAPILLREFKKLLRECT